MEDGKPERRPKCLARLRNLMIRHGSGTPREFLNGAAYSLGSGAVTLIILWWEVRC